MKWDVFNICLFLLSLCNAVRYEPNWKSIDSRPLPSWYDQGKIGIFIHWGVFSVPSFSTEWFWWQWKGSPPVPGVEAFMKDNYKPGFTYADFAPEFTAEFYNPNEWAELFNASGAQYVVLTTKHHEGFCNWHTNYSWNWNSMSTGPNRDLVGDLADAIRKYTDMRFGVYHSLFEWFNPLYLQDQANNYQTQKFVESKTLPELYELVNTYKPDLIWSDGDWMVSSDYWNATQFLAWLYNDSPVKDYIIVNDRWGNDSRCKHGGFLDCSDSFDPGTLQKRKWENCMHLDKYSWGYRRNMKIDDVLSMVDLLSEMMETISCGGNILINIGPTKSGEIIPVFQERLRSMGDWLKVNGEAIYGSVPWSHQNDTVTRGIWYTSKKGPEGRIVYASISSWPEKDQLFLGAPKPTASTKVTLLGYPQQFEFKPGPSGGITLSIPVISIFDMPCQWVWIFKMEGLKN
ncbi:hypothetical protein LOTGIDRAFT_230702 [Lottia gigantea]|uniref:alpha-L-fucosidase n=1 Tax=Lottia gigantea TaxID=225164 RepID=V4B5U1_LOTGI|nr:hypothetical protein LOTGIDRAFT_230702 [Lottia gigantea]ESP01432.1 hypothetical protein LOTGIDRAFT_230702 [Lottia gigantea]